MGVASRTPLENPGYGLAMLAMQKKCFKSIGQPRPRIFVALPTSLVVPESHKLLGRPTP